MSPATDTSSTITPGAENPASAPDTAEGMGPAASSPDSGSRSPPSPPRRSR
jgi:hypothetical protein